MRITVQKPVFSLPSTVTYVMMASNPHLMSQKHYKKGSILRSISGGVSVLGGLFGGAIGNMASSAGHGSDILSERFTGMSPEWQKEHEQAFQRAQNEAQQHFHRCHGCRQWICDADYNEDEDLCVDCAPRENVTVAKVKANRMVREIEEEAEGAKVFRGKIESKLSAPFVVSPPARVNSATIAVLIFP